MDAKIFLNPGNIAGVVLLVVMATVQSYMHTSSFFNFLIILTK